MSDLGLTVIKNIYEGLEIDDEWSSEIPRGFEWWGHRLKQRIWVSNGYDDAGIEIFRVFINTDLIHKIDETKSTVENTLAEIGVMASTAAMVFDPKDRRLSFWSAITIHQDVAGWLTRLAVSFAILQISEAERIAAKLAGLIKGEPEFTRHRISGERPDADEMLGVVPSLFIPKGQDKSPWNGNGELNQIQDMFNEGNCFSMGDDTGLTAEFPFGEQSSMMRVITNEPHRILGNGVGMFLHLPIRTTNDECSSIACALNRAEADKSAVGHFLGSWCVKELGNFSVPAFAFFIPALLYQPGILTNLIMSMVQRAFWAKDVLEPETPNIDILSVINRRLEGFASPK